jgi:hypothetical protein
MAREKRWLTEDDNPSIVEAIPLTNPPFCLITPGRQTASRALLGRANSRIPNILPRLLPITKTPTSLPGLK